MKLNLQNTKYKIPNIEHAITLLALIITVIILLILATVSISLIINSGILDHAQQGVDRYSEEEELEQIKLAVASARLKGNGFLTTENLNSELQERIDENEEAEKVGHNWYYKGHIIEENGNIEKYDKLLPKEYQQVEYIEGTGTQYIDTGIKLSQDSISMIDMQITANGNYHIFGARKSATQNSIHCCFSNVDNFYRADFQDWQANSLNIMPHYNRTIIKISKEELSIGEISKKIDNYSNFETPSNALIFYTSGYTASNYKIAKMKLYLCIILEKGISRRNFIPCYSTTTVTDVDGISRPKDTIGLYDTVEGKFYVNKGTGTFLKGADV